MKSMDCERSDTVNIKPITRRQAKAIGEKTGYPITEGDGRTFYATNEEETEVWEFDSKAERDRACKQ